MAGVQKGGSGEVKFESVRRARSAIVGIWEGIVGIWEGSLGSGFLADRSPRNSRSNLTSPHSPLCTPATQAIKTSQSVIELKITLNKPGTSCYAGIIFRAT